MATKKNDSYWHDASLQAIAVMMGLLLVIPSILRWSEGRWAGGDWAVLIAGGALAAAWSSGKVVGMVRRRRGQHRGLIRTADFAQRHADPPPREALPVGGIVKPRS